jgi:hypothetical protein
MEVERTHHGLNKRKNLVGPLAGMVTGLFAPLGELLQLSAERFNDSCKTKPGVGGVHESVI